jgi:RNA polymerase sigma factor (sigma-70 family)
MGSMRGSGAMHDPLGEPSPDLGTAQLARIVARRTDPTGAADALCVLYAIYGVPILRYLYFLTQDRGYAEELNQDVFLAVWNGAASFDGRASVSGWLYAIARRKVRDGRRRHRLPTVAEDQISEAEAIDPAPEQVAIGRLELEAVINRLKSLAPHHQEVLTLVARELSMRDLAVILNTPIGTVKSRLFAARKALERAVEGEAQ